MKIEINKMAPKFNLSDENGKNHKVSDYKGKWILLYFYPKDMTPGCTIEARGFRDNWKEFEKNNAVVLGVSADSVERHIKFKEKNNLPFTLLSDVDKKVVQEYGVWVEKSMFGKKYMGIRRSSVLISPDGKVVKIYEKVSPLRHAKEVLEDLKLYK